MERIQALRESHFVEFLHRVNFPTLMFFLIAYAAIFWYIGYLMFGAILLVAYFLLFLFYDIIQHRFLGKMFAYLFITFMPVIYVTYMPYILDRPANLLLLWMMILLTLISIPQVLSAVHYRKITKLNSNSLSFFLIHFMSFFVATFFSLLYFSFLALFIIPLIEPIGFSALMILLSFTAFVFSFAYYTFFFYTVKRTVHEEYFEKAKFGKLNRLMHRLFQTNHKDPEKEMKYIFKLCFWGWIVVLVLIFVLYMSFSSLSVGHIINSAEKYEETRFKTFELEMITFEDETLNAVAQEFKEQYDIGVKERVEAVRGTQRMGKSFKRFFRYDYLQNEIDTWYAHFFLGYKTSEYKRMIQHAQFLALLSKEQREEAYLSAEYLEAEIRRVVLEHEIEHGVAATNLPQLYEPLMFRNPRTMFEMMGNMIVTSTIRDQLGRDLEQNILKLHYIPSPASKYYASGPDNGYFFHAIGYAKLFSSQHTRFCKDDTCVFDLASKLYIPHLCARASPSAQSSCYSTLALRMGTPLVCKHLVDKNYIHKSILGHKTFLKDCQAIFAEQETN